MNTLVTLKSSSITYLDRHILEKTFWRPQLQPFVGFAEAPR